MKILWLLVSISAFGLCGCGSDDGLPDPPLQMLVPCDPTPDSPIACPPDAAAIVDAGSD
jgi:hypothetical protein